MTNDQDLSLHLNPAYIFDQESELFPVTFIFRFIQY